LSFLEEKFSVEEMTRRFHTGGIVWLLMRWSRSTKLLYIVSVYYLDGSVGR